MYRVLVNGNTSITTTSLAVLRHRCFQLRNAAGPVTVERAMGEGRWQELTANDVHDLLDDSWEAP